MLVLLLCLCDEVNFFMNIFGLLVCFKFNYFLKFIFFGEFCSDDDIVIISL